MRIARRSLDNRCVNLLARRTATLSTQWKPHDYCFVQTGMNVFCFCFVFLNGAMSNATGQNFHPLKLYNIHIRSFPFHTMLFVS